MAARRRKFYFCRNSGRPGAYKDGTYYGTGTGFGGTLKVKVEISGGKITDIQIMENQDGSEYFPKPLH